MTKTTHKATTTPTSNNSANDPTTQPMIGQIESTVGMSVNFCTTISCDATEWISRDDPTGTGDHEMFKLVIFTLYR